MITFGGDQYWVLADDIATLAGMPDFAPSNFTPGVNTTNAPGTTFLACFAAGTLIATPNGERVVESLQIGDLVLTAEGEAVAVKWLGRQTVGTRFASLSNEPVRIRAGALGKRMPHSDLVVTADHGMVVDGYVINAAALVNGDTIDWVPSADLPARVTYYHVETENHDVILANGAPAETFVDHATRQAFDNHQDYVELYGAESVIHDLDMPRISSRRLVPEHIKQRLGIVDPAIPLEPAQIA